MEAIEITLFILSILVSFASGYCFCYVKNTKKEKISKIESKINIKSEQKEEIQNHSPVRIVLKTPLRRRYIPREPLSTRTADELTAEMNARYQAIMSGDYSKIKPAMIVHCY